MSRATQKAYKDSAYHPRVAGERNARECEGVCSLVPIVVAWHIELLRMQPTWSTARVHQRAMVMALKEPGISAHG